MKQEIARESSRQTVVPKVWGIPFSDIPGQSRLFTTYLSDPLSLKSYYPNAVVSPLEVAAFAPSVFQHYTTDRSALCNLLAEYNGSLGASAVTMGNIQRLEHEGVVAVVTGQQAGLFGGPLYTLYKALTAIRMADDLSKAGTPAVPVFWIATEDHDMTEVSRTYFLDSSHLITSDYIPHSYETDTAVGEVEIDDSISRVIDTLFDALPTTGFSDDVRDVLTRCWRSGNTFGLAFGETLATITSSHGLIMLDPLDPGLKRLAAPLYARAVEMSDEIVSAVKRRNEQLEKDGFHSQVLVGEDYFPLFWNDDDGARTALRKSGGESFRTKGGAKKFTRAELLRLVEDEPERFSPGVMLRAAVQDYLLPSVVNIGGGAEISYFAQNSAVYQTLDRPVTPIFHRQSFTMIEPKTRRMLDKLGLDFSDLFNPRDKVVMDWAREKVDPETAGVFASAEETINTEMNRIDQHLAAIDPTLLDNLAKRRRKMIYHIGALKKKALLALSRKNSDAERRINDLFTAIMPNGQLQERSINAFSFLNKYGPELVSTIYAAIDLDDKRHRIIEL